MVFAPDFDGAEALAREQCPRCGTVGLMPSDYDAYHAAPTADQFRSDVTICPPLYAWCPACGLVGEWLVMCALGAG